MSVGLYDGDFQRYFHCPFNLELMKIATYYKNNNQIVSLSPTLCPEKFTKFFYRKDYYDGIFPEKIITNKNVEYGGLAFTNNIYKPMDIILERQKPDTSIYQNILKIYFDFKPNRDLRKNFSSLINAQHLRLSLDGKTLWKDFEKQLFNIENTSAFFFHDSDLGKIKDSYEVVQYLLKLRKDTLLPQRIGMKFNTTVETNEDLLKWGLLNNLGNFFSLEFQGIINDEVFYELITKISKNKGKQIEYNITKNLSNENEFFLSRLPKIYHQLLFCRDNRQFLLLKYEKNFFSDKNGERLVDLLNCYIRSASRSNYNNWEKYNSDDSLFKFCSSFENYKYLKENFTKKEAREIFTYVSEKNYELFKEFYETKHIKLINGEFNYE